MSNLGLAFANEKGMAAQSMSDNADEQRPALDQTAAEQQLHQEQEHEKNVTTDEGHEEVRVHSQEEIQEKARQRWVGPDPRDSFRHWLMRLPAHPDCDICKFAKIVHAPSKRQKQFVRVQALWSSILS